MARHWLLSKHLLKKKKKKKYTSNNTKLNQSEAGIKIIKRNINNLRYADETTNGRK